jgi:hypothetical protein
VCSTGSQLELSLNHEYCLNENQQVATIMFLSTLELSGGGDKVYLYVVEPLRRYPLGLE